MLEAPRECEICHALVPPVPADEAIEFEDGPPSLIEHRWSVHGIHGFTRCSHCAEAMGVDSLADHLSLAHNLPPPRSALRRLRDSERRIRDEIAEAGEKISDSVKTAVAAISDSAETDVESRPGTRRTLRSQLFWTIVAAVVTGQLLYALILATIRALLQAGK